MLLNGHADRLNWAEFSADGKRVVTTSWDKTARIWDAATGRQLAVLSGHSDSVSTATFSPDGQLVLTASFDKTARIWDSFTGREVRILSGHGGAVTSAGFARDGQRIVTSSNDKTARVWDTASGRQLLVVLHPAKVNTAAFSPDGIHVVTSSFDSTGRIWDVRTAPIEVQVRWVAASQFDALPGAERFELGLPVPHDVRQWSSDRSKCDEAAAAPYDPDRHAPGALIEQIVGDIAERACETEGDGEARALYQLGRALIANGKLPAARQALDRALAMGYRSAAVDLATLLSQEPGSPRDVAAAVSLYESAYRNGVAIAAFHLGRLYEHGVSATGSSHEYWLAPDSVRAWGWYQKAVDLAEPNALARFAESADEAAFHETSPAGRTAHRLEAFARYAAAAERARLEDWPEESHRNWRYHRASLARLLANDGMMQEVADAYEKVRRQYAPRPAMRERLLSFLNAEGP